jgi:hypothetical protein
MRKREKILKAARLFVFCNLTIIYSLTFATTKVMYDKYKKDISET